MNITKIRQTDISVTISYAESFSEECINKGAMTSRDMPRPEFSEAMRALRPVFRNICEFTHDEASNYIVNEISFYSTNTGKKSAAITASRVMKVGKPLEITTPQRLIDTDGEDAWMMLDPNDVLAIEAIKNEAQRYLNHEREQQELPIN